MMDPEALYRLVYEYDTLEAAYCSAYEYLEAPPEDEDAWLIDLQNHLVWRSYQTGYDPDWDVVVLEAISTLVKRLGLRANDVTGETRRILNELTLV